MLVISRKVGESIILSDNIKITVFASGNDKVSLGIEAPMEIKIIREELLEIIEANIASSEKIDNGNFVGIATLLKNRSND